MKLTRTECVERYMAEIWDIFRRPKVVGEFVPGARLVVEHRPSNAGHKVFCRVRDCGKRLSPIYFKQSKAVEHWFCVSCQQLFDSEQDNSGRTMCGRFRRDMGVK